MIRWKRYGGGRVGQAPIRLKHAFLPRITSETDALFQVARVNAHVHDAQRANGGACFSKEHRDSEVGPGQPWAVDLASSAHRLRSTPEPFPSQTY